MVTCPICDQPIDSMTLRDTDAVARPCGHSIAPFMSDDPEFLAVFGAVA